MMEAVFGPTVTVVLSGIHHARHPILTKEAAATISREVASLTKGGDILLHEDGAWERVALPGICDFDAYKVIIGCEDETYQHVFTDLSPARWSAHHA